MAGTEDINEKLLQIAKYNNKNQFDKAIKEYKQLLATYRSDPKILNSMGDTYAKMNDIDNALRCYDESADQYAKDGVWPNAIAILKKLLRLKPEKLDTKFKIAEMSIQMKAFNDAEYYLIEYGEFYIKAGDVQKAIPAYEKITSISPDNMERKVKLADLYFFTGNTDKMLSTYQAVFNYYKAVKNQVKIQEIFNTITAISSKNQLLMTPTYFNIFLSYIDHLLSEQQDDELAISTAMDMINRLFEVNDFDKAEALCLKLIEKRPDLLPARFKLIDIYDKSGDTGKLIDGYLSVGKYFASRDPGRAEVLYKKVLQLDSSNEEANAFLGIKKTQSADNVMTSQVQPLSGGTAIQEASDIAEGIIEGSVDIIHTVEKNSDDLDHLIDKGSLGISSATYDEEQGGKELGTFDLTQVVAEDDGLKARLAHDITAMPSKNQTEEVPEFSAEDLSSVASVQTEPEKEVIVQPVSVQETHDDDDDDIEIEIEIDEPSEQTAAAESSNKRAVSEPITEASIDIPVESTVVQGNEDLDGEIDTMFTEYSSTSEQKKSLLEEISDKQSTFVPNLDAIVTEFKRGLEEQLEGDPQAHYDMGTSFLSMEMFDEAMDEFRKLTTIAQFKYKSHDGLARCHMAKQEYDAAIEEYFIALDMENLSQDELDATYFNLSRAYFQKGDLIEANKNLGQIRQIELFEKNDEYTSMHKQFKVNLPSTDDAVFDINEDAESEITIDADGTMTIGSDIAPDLVNDSMQSPFDDYSNNQITSGSDAENNLSQGNDITVEASGIETGSSIFENTDNNTTSTESIDADPVIAEHAVAETQPVYVAEIANSVTSVQQTATSGSYPAKAAERLDAEVNKLRLDLVFVKDNMTGQADAVHEISEQLQQIEHEQAEFRDTIQEFSQVKEAITGFHETMDIFRSRIEQDVTKAIQSTLAQSENTQIIEDINRIKTEMEGYRELSVREKEILNQFMKYREDFDTFSDEISGLKITMEKNQALEERISSMLKKLEILPELETRLQTVEMFNARLGDLDDRLAELEAAVGTTDKLRNEMTAMKTLIHDIDSKVYMLESKRDIVNGEAGEIQSRQSAFPETQSGLSQNDMQSENYDSMTPVSESINGSPENIVQNEERPRKKESKKSKKDKISFL